MAALELAEYFIKTGPRQVTHRFLTHTHTHTLTRTHTIYITCSVCARRQVVELHLEELWGYTIVEESTDCAPAPTPSLRCTTLHNLYTSFHSLHLTVVIQTMSRLSQMNCIFALGFCLHDGSAVSTPQDGTFKNAPHGGSI